MDSRSGCPVDDIRNDKLKKALQISRQYMILIEDYRYLLSCFQNTCGCHSKFDHQIFFRRIESKYTGLTEVAKSNDFLHSALNDDPEENLENLVSEESLEPPRKRQYIVRRNILDRPRPSDDVENNVPEPEVRESQEEMSSGEDGSDKVKTAYRCTFTKCDYLTFDQDEVAFHLKNHNGANASQSQSEKRDVLYVCEQCSKEFTCKKWLENHVENAHAYIKMLACDYPNCNYKSKFRCVLDDHRRRHSKAKDFKCTWENCDAEFVTKRDMVAHINFSHKGIKNYFCNWEGCDASFKDSNRLRHHLFTHTGERPYHCDHPDCDASFKQLPHLNKHRKTHQAGNERGSGRHKCEQCDKRFRTVEDLANHITIHE